MSNKLIETQTTYDLSTEITPLERLDLNTFEDSTNLRKYRATINSYINEIDTLRKSKKKQMLEMFDQKWEEYTKEEVEDVTKFLEEADKELEKKVTAEKVAAIKEFNTEVKAAFKSFKSYNLTKEQLDQLKEEFIVPTTKKDLMSNHKRINSKIELEIEDYIINNFITKTEEVEEIKEEVEQKPVQQATQSNKFSIVFEDIDPNTIIKLLRDNGVTDNWTYQEIK